LKTNEERYGYPSCPCRIGTGEFEIDRDIICPCDYRDPDVIEYGACYCALYVDAEINEGKKEAPMVPERRSMERQLTSLQSGIDAPEQVEVKAKASDLKYEKTTRKVHYCRQCGYMAFREEPPYICPVCRATREMFSELKPRLHLLSG
jgi:ferredoxin-thioredoxin reductase catalytic subunit